MKDIIRLLKDVTVVLAVLSLCLLALSKWAIAPFHETETVPVGTATQIMQAPFAQSMVIGDSRVADLPSDNQTLFIGYYGATIPQMERIAGLACMISDKPVVIALGVNDAILLQDNLDASIASLERIVEGCAPAQVALAQIWPPERGKGHLGDKPDLEAIAQLDQAMAELAEREGVYLVPVPELASHTTDGVHFTPEVTDLYAETLRSATALREE